MDALAVTPHIDLGDDLRRLNAAPLFARLYIPGMPQGQGRPRFIKETGRAHPAAKTASYEAEIRQEAVKALGGRSPLTGPVGLVVAAIFPVPQSWSGKRQRAAVYQASRPDFDNIAKVCGDCTQHILIVNDTQIAVTLGVKRYSHDGTAGLLIGIYDLMEV